MTQLWLCPGFRDEAEQNKYSEVPGPLEKLPEAAAPSTLNRGIGSHTFAEAWLFLSLARVYTLGLPTLNPTLCHIPSQWGDKGKIPTFHSVSLGSSIYDEIDNGVKKISYISIL